MTSRDVILQSIRENKPEFSPVPEIPAFSEPPSEVLTQFIQVAQASGSTVLENTAQMQQWLETEFAGQKRIISLVDEFAGNLAKDERLVPKDLNQIDLAICYTPLGVAENGAIWLSENECHWRILPFISEHLMVLLKKSDIVSNMHQAYQKIKGNTNGFSVFIAGPSKTADIEQSLVVGAQGSRSHTIVLL